MCRFVVNPFPLNLWEIFPFHGFKLACFPLFFLFYDFFLFYAIMWWCLSFPSPLFLEAHQCRERALDWMNCELYPAPTSSLVRTQQPHQAAELSTCLSTADAWAWDWRTCADYKTRDHTVPVTLTGIYTFWLYECMYV